MHASSTAAASPADAAAVAVPGHAGNDRLEAGDAPRCRDRRDDVPVDAGLRFRALDVHDRRLAGDRDRFLKGANSEVAVDSSDKGPAQLDAFAFHRAEAG